MSPGPHSRTITALFRGVMSSHTEWALRLRMWVGEAHSPGGAPSGTWTFFVDITLRCLLELVPPSLSLRSTQLICFCQLPGAGPLEIITSGHSLWPSQWHVLMLSSPLCFPSIWTPLDSLREHSYFLSSLLRFAHLWCSCQCPVTASRAGEAEHTHCFARLLRPFVSGSWTCLSLEEPSSTHYIALLESSAQETCLPLARAGRVVVPGPIRDSLSHLHLGWTDGSSRKPLRSLNSCSHSLSRLPMSSRYLGPASVLAILDWFFGFWFYSPVSSTNILLLFEVVRFHFSCFQLENTETVDQSKYLHF